MVRKNEQLREHLKHSDSNLDEVSNTGENQTVKLFRIIWHVKQYNYTMKLDLLITIMIF